MSDLLLDTCALIWTALSEPISSAARLEIEREPLHISPISALEIATLVRRNRLMISAPTKLWFSTLLRRLDAKLADLSADLLIASAELPGDPPKDPYDRIVIATARAQGLKLVTRDRVILNYARLHKISLLAC